MDDDLHGRTRPSQASGEVFVAGKATWEASGHRVHAWESREGQLLFWPSTGHVGGRWPCMGKGLASLA